MGELNEQQLYKTDALSSHGYTFIKFLDQGGFGRVVLAKEEGASSAELRAVKVLINPANKDAAVHEIKMNQILQSDRQDCFVRFLSHFTHNMDYFFVLEYMAEGRLGSWLLEYYPKGAGFRTVQVVARKLFQALDFLEQHSMLHGDLKLDNVLLASRDPHSLKLADFGNATILTSKDAPMRYPLMQVPNFRAPEVFLQYPTNSVLAPDMWGVGCLLLHVILGQRMFPYSPDLKPSHYLKNYYRYLGCAPQHMLDKCPFVNIKDVDRSKYPQNSKKLLHLFVDYKPWCRSQAIAVYDVVRRALDLDPEIRIKPGAALNHPFFSSS